MASRSPSRMRNLCPRSLSKLVSLVTYRTMNTPLDSRVVSCTILSANKHNAVLHRDVPVFQTPNSTKIEQESPAVAREDALQPIQFLLQY